MGPDVDDEGSIKKVVAANSGPPVDSTAPLGKPSVDVGTACENDLHSIGNQERYRALLCLQNLDAIEAWRATVDAANKAQANHVGAVWHAWRRATRAQTSAAARQPVRGATPHRGGQGGLLAASISQPRGATAIREARSNDCIVLARRCLEAALRTELDLLELLPDPPPKPALTTSSPISYTLPHRS